MSIQNNLNIRDSARLSRLRSFANKVQPTCFAAVLIFDALHCICFIKAGWSCLELSFCIVLLLKQQMLLGVSKVVKMATRCGKDNFRWHDD